MKITLSAGKATPSLLLLSTLGLIATSTLPAEATLPAESASTDSSILPELTSPTETAQVSELSQLAIAPTATTETPSETSHSLAETLLALEEPSSPPLAQMTAPASTLQNNRDASTDAALMGGSRSFENTALETDLNSPEEPTTSVQNLADAADNGDSMAQLNSVSQLADVQPTDWAYEALRSLVERYGCIVGYPDGTYRGNRPLTRYEFAAGLNACLDRVNELIVAGLAESVTQDDLSVLQRLQEEFAAELATLRGRVDALESRTAELEANQFSTTTKLFGQAVIGVQGRSDNEYEYFLDEYEDDSSVNVITNVQLSLVTQLGPRSLLLTGLQAGDGNSGDSLLANFLQLGYEGDTDHDFVLSDLTYRQLIGNNFALIAGPEGVNPVNVFRGANRVESAGFGPISRFAQRNPIINIGSGSGGAGFDWQINPRISLQGVYSASTPAETEDGLFGGEDGVTTIGAQLVVSPVDTVDIAFQYVNSYSPFGRLFTGVGDDLLALQDNATGRAPIQTNAFGSALEWRITPAVTAGGWFGFTTSDLLGESGNIETTNWMAYLNFPDLLGEGNLGGLYVGQPPKITDSDLPDGRNVPSFVSEGNFLAEAGDQPGTTTHIEAFYRLRLTDNISLTPGVIVLLNPGHNSNNDTITIGALRTTFTF